MDESLHLSLDGHCAFHFDGVKATAELRSQIPEAYVWMDWFGVPQATSQDQKAGINEDTTQSDAAKAIQSIPGYVERSNLLVALVPDLFHTDTDELCNRSSWLSRGWCEAELLCHILANKKDTTVVTISASMSAELTVCRVEWDAVKNSAFTVESDRSVVTDLVNKALSTKIRHATDSGNLAVARYLLAGQAVFNDFAVNDWDVDFFCNHFRFCGLPEAAQQASPCLSHFVVCLPSLSRNLLLKKSRGPMTGLLCAVLSGNTRMIRILVEAAADVTWQLSSRDFVIILWGRSFAPVLHLRI